MGRLLTFTMSETQNKKATSTSGSIMPRIKIGPVSLTFITIILACLLCLFYLVQSNVVATKSYDIRELESKKEQIQEENEGLQLEAARSQSIKEVEEKAKDLEMVPSKKVNFITPSSGVASK